MVDVKLPCPTCGQSIDSTWDKCPYCGIKTNFEQPKDNRINEILTANTQLDGTLKKKISKRKIVVIITAALLSLCICLTIIGALSSSSSSSDDTLSKTMQSSEIQLTVDSVAKTMMATQYSTSQP